MESIFTNKTSTKLCVASTYRNRSSISNWNNSTNLRNAAVHGLCRRFWFVQNEESKMVKWFIQSRQWRRQRQIWSNFFRHLETLFRLLRLFRMFELKWKREEKKTFVSGTWSYLSIIWNLLGLTSTCFLTCEKFAPQKALLKWALSIFHYDFPLRQPSTLT